MLVLKSGLDMTAKNTPYVSGPYCSCHFYGNASCRYSSNCTHTGGGQCAFSTPPPSACGS